MQIIEKNPGDQIKLGRAGEYNARQIALNLSAWEKTYGAEGTAQLLYQRPGDTSPYPVKLNREGSLAVWTVSATETANAGSDGCAELRYYVGETMIKSAVSQVVVEAALETVSAEDAEEPAKSWVDQILQAGSSAQASSQQAEKQATQAKASAEASQSSAARAESLRAQTAQDKESASQQAALAAQQALLARSWSSGGSGVRDGEETENSKYWAEVAKAEAKRLSATEWLGNYSVVLVDQVTQQHYTLIVEHGELNLLAISENLDATKLNLFDHETGTAYTVLVEDGRLCLEEV